MTSVSAKSPRTARLGRTLLALIAGVLVAFSASLALAGEAAAITPCGKRVLDDWWDNGRVDRLYPPHCYEEAIDGIPRDIRAYSDAEQVLSRALQAAVRGKLAPPGKDPSPDDPGDRGNPADPGNAEEPGDRDPATPADPGGNSSDPTGGGSVASPEVDGSGTSSVPIPLLVLGGLSLALLAAGGLGYLSRRRQAADALDDESDLPG